MKSRKIGRINGTRKYGNNVRKNTVKRGGRFTGLFGSFSKDPNKNLEAINKGEKRFGIKYGNYRSQIAKGLLKILHDKIDRQRLIVKTASNNIDPTTFESKDNSSMEDQRRYANEQKKILEDVKKHYTGERGNWNIAQAMAVYAHKSSLERHIYDDITVYGNTTKFFDFAIKHASQNLKSSNDNSTSEKSKIHDIDALEDEIVKDDHKSTGSMNAKPRKKKA